MIYKHRWLALVICLSTGALNGMHSEKGKKVAQADDPTRCYHGKVPLSLNEDDCKKFPGLKANPVSAPITREQTSAIVTWLKSVKINEIKKEAPIVIHYDMGLVSLYALENKQPYMKAVLTEKRKEFLQKGFLVMGIIKNGVFKDLSGGITAVY